ncbi:hypothetical protein SAZ11_59125 [Streptomyces sp. FXJ1.4098]|nr:hypothetical protein [Streptomyces sp. FXJ1.4098]
MSRETARTCWWRSEAWVIQGAPKSVRTPPYTVSGWWPWSYSWTSVCASGSSGAHHHTLGCPARRSTVSGMSRPCSITSACTPMAPRAPICWSSRSRESAAEAVSRTRLKGEAARARRVSGSASGTAVVQGWKGVPSA